MVLVSACKYKVRELTRNILKSILSPTNVKNLIKVERWIEIDKREYKKKSQSYLTFFKSKLYK